MISTVVWISWTRLLNNRQELVLVFAVPVIFFSVFAIVFTRGLGGDSAEIRLAVVDEDQSAWSKRVIDQLAEQTALKVRSGYVRTDEQDVVTLGREISRTQQFDLVLHVPVGAERTRRQRKEVELSLLDEGTNPIARQMAGFLLQQAVAVADQPLLPNRAAPESPLRRLPRAAPSRPLPRADRTTRRRTANKPSSIDASVVPAAVVANVTSPGLQIQEIQLFGQDQRNPKVAMYAAGIAVMFLLFSTTGAGGSLLEEQEAGTLERLLQSRLTLTQLLMGKWVYITMLGCLQVTVMFVWAQLAFQVDLLGHLSGFAVMTLATSAATASVALCLAVFCRSRAQLTGVSVVLILTMSALGGSMIPRYLMSESMQRWGRITFNAWAIDGYQKVFWHELPVAALRNEVLVMAAIAFYLAIVARVFAERLRSA